MAAVLEQRKSDRPERPVHREVLLHVPLPFACRWSLVLPPAGTEANRMIVRVRV